MDYRNDGLAFLQHDREKQTMNVITVFFKMIGWFGTIYSLAAHYLSLPKLLSEYWKDKDKLYLAIHTLLYSKFMETLVTKTKFYVDDILLAKLKVLMENKENFYKVYDVITGVSSVDTLPLTLWNFVQTVRANRSLLA
jgi:hypothetical protein